MTRHTKYLRSTVAAFAVAALALVGCELENGDPATDPDLGEPDTTEPTEPDTTDPNGEEDGLDGETPDTTQPTG